LRNTLTRIKPVYAVVSSLRVWSCSSYLLWSSFVNAYRTETVSGVVHTGRQKLVGLAWEYTKYGNFI